MRWTALSLAFLPFLACGGFTSHDPGTEGTPAPGGDGGPGSSVEGGGGSDAGNTGGDVGTPGTNGIPLDGVFVSTSLGHDDSGDGTVAHPYQTLKIAVAAAKTKAKPVIACNEIYAEQLTLVSGVSIFGNYDCTQTPWAQSTKNATLQSPSSPALIANAITDPTRLSGLDIIAPDAASPDKSSIGVLAVGSTTLALDTLKVHAGKALDGTDGTDGTQLANDATIDATTTSGAANTCGGQAGTRAGGKGGNAASASSWKCDMMSWTLLSGGVASNPTGDGKNGTEGASCCGDGVTGTDCIASAGTFAATGFAPCDGTAGTDGHGGVGGAGAPETALPYTPPNNMCPNSFQGKIVTEAAGSSGGGAGGCPGLAGVAGTGGGGSIAILAVSSPLSLGVAASATTTAGPITLETGAGGKGGKGAPGSAPTGGGNGLDMTGAEMGGPGGEPGICGSGAGGPSVGVAYSKDAPPVFPVPAVDALGKPGDGVSALTSADNMRTVPASAAGAGGESVAF